VICFNQTSFVEAVSHQPIRTPTKIRENILCSVKSSGYRGVEDRVFICHAHALAFPGWGYDTF
jgi:hypothetical protein